MTLSTCHWNLRSPLRALIFWLWLVSFVVSFVGNPLFHASDCVGQFQLAVSADSHAVFEAPANSDLHQLCAACALEAAFAAVLIIVAPLLVALSMARIFARFLPVCGALFSIDLSARGPPVWVSI